MYGSEVPAYNTLVEVSTQVNRDYATRHAGAEQSPASGRYPQDSLSRVTAERHGAIRVGTPDELAAVAELFAAFGMAPVGYYDLRDAASPVPVVSTAFRPIDAQELAHNPFRVFTSVLSIRDPRFFDAELRARVQRFLGRRALFDPALLCRARVIAADGGCDADEADDFVAQAVAAFALSREPIEKSWYDELSRVSAVAADIAGVGSTHINHLTPRVLDIDDLYRRMTERGITMIDGIQGPPRWDGPAMLLRQTSFRALAEPRRFRSDDGTIVDGDAAGALRRGRGTRCGADPEGPGTLRRRDGRLPVTPIPLRCGPSTSRPPTTRWPLRVWPTTAAATPPNLLSTKTFCPHRRPASFAPTSTVTVRPRDVADDSRLQRGLDGRGHRPPHSRPLRTLRIALQGGTRVTTVTSCAPGRARALDAVGCDVALGEPGEHGLPASTPITGEVLFTVAETTPEQAERCIADAAQAFSAWRTTPAPVRGALVARLASCSPHHRHDLATLVTIEAGKITSEALGEVQEMIDVCQFAVGLSRQLYGRTIASERPGHRLMETWHPLGVVGVITAFNFPVAVWAWNAAVALVCGDTVVWKPSELTPLTALACQALIDRAAADVGASAGGERA